MLTDINLNISIMKNKVLYQSPEIRIRALDLEGFLCASPSSFYFQVDRWDSSPEQDIMIGDDSEDLII